MIVGEKFDPTKYKEVTPTEPMQVGSPLDLSKVKEIKTPEVNIYDDDTKKVISMPATLDEDRFRYVKSTQAYHQMQSDFWGMSEAKNNWFSQMTRGFAGFGFMLPSQLRSVIKAAREEEITELEKAVEGEPVTAVAMAGMFPVAYTISPRQAKRDLIKNEKTVKKIDELQESAKKTFQKSKLAKTAADGFFYDIGSGVGSLGTAVALSFITKNPATAAVLFGGIQKGSSYEELRAKGYSPEYANKISNIAGVAEASLEFVGLDLFLKGMKGNKIIGRFIKGAITEGLQEASQTTSEELIMQKFGGREKEGMDTLKDIAYSGLLGMIIGAPTSAILGAGANIGKKKGISKKQSDTIINKVLTHNEIEGQTHKLFDNQMDPLTFPNADENLAVKGLDESLTEIETRKAEEAKGIKDKVTEMAINAGVETKQAEFVADIWQARADSAGASLGISPQEWLKAKNLQIIGEGKSINEAIQEETEIEAIEKPTEVLYQDAMPTPKNEIVAERDPQKSIKEQIIPEIDLPTTMPKEAKQEIMKFEVVSKSPYSDSYYDITNKSWDDDPDGFLRIADHWNFYSQDRLHAKTNIPVENNKEWVLARYDKAKGEYQVLKRWKITEEVKKISEAEQKEYFKKRPEIFKSRQFKKIRERYEKIFERMMPEEVEGEFLTAYSMGYKIFSRGQDLKTGEDIFYVKREYEKQRGKFVLKGFKPIRGKITKLTSAMITVKTAEGDVRSKIDTATDYGILKKGEPDILYQPARGQIEFGDDSTVIRLFQGKDRTTLLHETGHLFLRDMQAVAEQSQDPQAMEDMQVLRDFYKVKEGEAFKREQEEAFADDFVGFVMSGKAPSAKLVGAFERFKQWLLSMYERVKTRVTLTPEVREVMDRMLGGYDVETATNVASEYSGRLTELQTLSENIKAGKLADITQAQLDDFESLINAAKQRPPAEPQSLFGWIRRRGGIWDKGGELRNMDLPAGLIRTKADSYMPTEALYNALDTTREAAVAEGFIKEGADINDLLNAIDNEAKGDKVYRKDDMDMIRQRESVLKDKDDAEMILSQLEINPEEILQIIRKNRAKQLKAVPTPEFAGVMSRIERLERAIGRIATEQERLTEAQIKAITKADIKEVQNRVIDLIKSARLDPKDRAKFISAIKNIQTGEQLGKILPSLQERIARYRETTQKANIREQIRKELKTIKPAVISGKLKGKFDAETQEALQTFKDIQKMTIETAREKWQQVFEVAKAMQYKPSEVELKQHLWLQIQAYYPSSTQADLKEVLDFIKQLKSEARNKIFERMEADKARRKEVIERTTKAVAGIKHFDVKAIKEPAKRKFLSNWMNVWAHDWNSLMNKILTDKELSEKFFSVKVEDGEYELKKLWLKYDSTRTKMIMEAYNVPETKIAQVLSSHMDTIEINNLTGSDGVIRDHKITRGQLMTIYALSKNEQIYQDLTNPEKNAFSEMGLKTMFSYLTEGDIKFANLLMRYFDEVGHPELNKVVRKRNGVNLGRLKNYFPTEREGKHDEQDNIITQIIYQTSTTPKAIKLRRGSKEALKIKNILAVWEQYEEEKNIYISMGDTVTDINSIFRDTNLRKTVNGKMGGNAMQAIDAHLKTFGLKKQKEINTGWTKARGTFSGLKTSVATVVFVKQLTSWYAYREVLSKTQMLTGAFSFFKAPVKNAKFLYENSVFVQERWKRRSFDRDLKALNKLSLLKPISIWNTAMTSFVRMGDIMPILIGMHSMMKSGVSLREAERFSNRTQQSADSSKMSLAQKGNEAQMTFTIFKSTQLQYFRKSSIATRDGIRGDISLRKSAHINTIYMIILPALFSAAGQGFRPEKDWKEFFNNLITGNVGGIVFLGDLIKMATSCVFGVKYYPPSIPFWGEFEDITKEMTTLMQDGMDEVNWEDLLTSLIEVGSIPTGVMLPAKRIWNASEGIYEVFDGKNRAKGLLKIAGYTDYRAKKITGD